MVSTVFKKGDRVRYEYSDNTLYHMKEGVVLNSEYDDTIIHVSFDFQVSPSLVWNYRLVALDGFIKKRTMKHKMYGI
jgi:hypothetical protein